MSDLEVLGSWVDPLLTYGKVRKRRLATSSSPTTGLFVAFVESGRLLDPPRGHLYDFSMRFVCDSCRAQYMISDDKVGPKGVKVRCKKCGSVIWVRRPEDVAAPPNPAAHPEWDSSDDEPNGQTQVMNTAAMRAAVEKLKAEPTVVARSQIALNQAAPTPVRAPILGNVQEDEIGAAFDQALRSDDEETVARNPISDDDEDHAQTRVLDLKAVRALAQEAGVTGQFGAPSRGGAAAVAAAAPVNEPVHEWYVAINDNQVGPIDVEKVKSLWKAGEVGPDSLCWRVGFSDWVPLSEAAELASELAPRPAKPTIVAPATPAVSGRPPVESAFSGGRTTSGTHSAASASPGEGMDGGGWKPSAASGLASLVKEEIEALGKPAKTKSTAAAASLGAGTTGKEQAAPGLMEVPSAEFPLPAGGQRRDLPTRGPEVNSFGATGFSSYRPAPPPPSTFVSRNRGALLLAGGGLLVIGLLVAILVLLANPKTPAITVNVPPSQSTAPPPVPQAAAPVKRTEPAPEPAPEPSVATPAPKVDETAQLPPSPGQSALPPLHSVPERRRSRGERRSGASATAQVNDDDEVGSFTAGGTKANPPPDPSATDDDFEREFGGTRAAGGKGGKRRTPSTYVPPAPGSADIPESLSQSDVIQVVVQHKPAILKCVEEQKKVDPGTSGRLVMRWSILTTGRPSQVSTQSTEFKATPMAGCLTKLIPTWSFPRHKTQGPPIDFPFTF